MSLSNPIHSTDTVDGTVRVVMNRDEGYVRVLHTAEADELAQFNFNVGAEDSMSQREAAHRGMEYADGYAHGYDSGKEGK